MNVQPPARTEAIATLDAVLLNGGLMTAIIFTAAIAQSMGSGD